MPRWIARVAVWLFALFFALCSSLHAAPQTGWWWNPNESGRGFFVESHDGITFIGAYLYDSDGHAQWLVAGGPNADAYNFTGDLYYKTGGQTLFGSYVAPGNAVVVGQLSIHFSDDTHGSVTWPGGVVPIERQIYGSGAAPFKPLSGWWWNPDESGTGYSVELQGNNLFVVGFMYDTGGRPVWYYTAGPMTDASNYHGTVLQFANGQTITGPYQPPGTPTTIGTVDIQFAAENSATFTFTQASAAENADVRLKAGQIVKHEEPQFPKDGDFYPLAQYAGHYIVAFHTHDTTTPGIIADVDWTIRLDFTWHVGDFTTSTYEWEFDVDRRVPATITQTWTAKNVTVAGTCTQTGGPQTLPIGSSNGFLLTTSTFGEYKMTLAPDTYLLPITQTCVLDGHTIETNFTSPPLPFTFYYEGIVVTSTGADLTEHIAGSALKTISSPGAITTYSYDWDFASVP